LAKRCGSAAVGWNPRAVGEDEKLGPLWTKQLREGDLFMRYIEIPSKLPYRNSSDLLKPVFCSQWDNDLYIPQGSTEPF
jgi:hypothetical protein